ncbi:unnamed protein product [Gadus morhua 'NCC']
MTAEGNKASFVRCPYCWPSTPATTPTTPTDATTATSPATTASSSTAYAPVHPSSLFQGRSQIAPQQMPHLFNGPPECLRVGLEALPEAKATGRPKGFPRCLTTIELGQAKKGPQTASNTSKQPFISSSGCLSVTATMRLMKND